MNTLLIHLITCINISNVIIGVLPKMAQREKLFDFFLKFNNVSFNIVQGHSDPQHHTGQHPKLHSIPSIIKLWKPYTYILFNHLQSTLRRVISKIESEFDANAESENRIENKGKEKDVQVDI